MLLTTLRESGGGAGVQGLRFIAGTSKGGDGGGTTTAIDTTAGGGADLIVIALVASVASIAAVKASITDSVSSVFDGTFSGVNDGIAACGGTVIFVTNPTLSTTYTVTFAGGSAAQGICVAAYKKCSGGKDTSSAGGSSSASTTVQPGSVTPNQTNSLIITALFTSQFGGTYTANSGFTSPARVSLPSVNGQYYGCQIFDLIQGAPAAVNPTITSTVSTNGLGARSYVWKGVP